MPIVTFADLTHTGVGISANNNPLAIGYIAAYARAHLGNAIDARLFKYPSALSAFLARETPAIACFTNYMWNERLSCAYASQIKRHHPHTAVIMGGPNYPVNAAEQRDYLAAHPEIDFFVDGEGEPAFVGLFEALSEVDFDPARLKRHGVRVPGVHFMEGGEFVGGPPVPRILELDKTLPSPYTTGVLDEFFDDKLSPMMQTSRGCPYSCTFCHDGIAYMNKTRAFSQERVREELAYIERRTKTPTLQLADLNWGMFPADLENAKLIAETRRRSGWPRNVMTATAKNQKERIVEMSRVLGDALQVGASVQSTDADVLRQIKRSNISLDAIVRMTKGATTSHTGSFTEIILGLPGDTREKHLASVADMLDAGISDLRLFQFILLPGTEGSDASSRQRYQYETGFRVLARCFGRYEVYGADVPVAETQEICLGNATMPHEDYVACRAFDLTVAIFNNGGILKEFFRLAEVLGIRRSIVLARIHELALADAGQLKAVYDEFLTAEPRNLFPDQQSLDAFLARPGTLDAYLRGEYGVNHIYKARTEALLILFPVIAEIARQAVSLELAARGLLDETLERYLDELLQLSIVRKSGLVDLDRSTELTLHFDFPALQEVDYLANPRRVVIAEGLRFVVSHTSEQKATLEKYFQQYGREPLGLGWFIQRNDSHVGAMLYRAIDYAEPYVGAVIAPELPLAARMDLAEADTTENAHAVPTAPASIAAPPTRTETRRIEWARPVTTR